MTSSPLVRALFSPSSVPPWRESPLSLVRVLASISSRSLASIPVRVLMFTFLWILASFSARVLVNSLAVGSLAGFTVRSLVSGPPVRALFSPSSVSPWRELPLSVLALFLAPWWLPWRVSPTLARSLLLDCPF